MLRQTLERTKNSVVLPLYFVGFLWLIHIVNSALFSYSFSSLGIVPRTFSGLSGIFFAPFLHGSYNHIIGNSIMIFLLSWIICFYNKKIWFQSLLWGTLVGGLITWLIGSSGLHIGASILVFALWGTILGLAIFQRNAFFIIASLILCSTYGVSMFMGLVPQPNISFAGHLGGLIAGFICAKNMRKQEY